MSLKEKERMSEGLGAGEGVMDAINAAPMVAIGQSLNFTTFEPSILEAASGNGSAAANVAATVSAICSSIGSAIGAAFGFGPK